MKNKIMVMLLGLSLVLAGCGSSGNQKSPENTANSKPPSQQSSNTGSGKNNSHSGQSPGTTESNQNGGSSTGSNNTPSHSPTPPVNNPAPSNLDMSMVTAVRLADFNTGWAGGNGWVAKTINGGKSWAVVYQGSGTVKQIFALNHSDVWAAFNEGGNVSKLLHSSDGGQHWVIVGSTPNNAFFHFNSKMTGFSGNYFSQDGGKTWHPLPLPENAVGDAYFNNQNNGWVVTQINNKFFVNRTTDGGKSWKTIMTKTLYSRLNGIQIRSAGTNDAWIELVGDSGMSQTSYSVFHTNDGGKSWRTVIAKSTAGGGPAPGFSQDDQNVAAVKGSKPGPLYVVNSKTAFMGGSCPACDHQNTIGWTKDGGNTWGNSNITLDGYGDALLAFADGNHGWWITTENQKPSKMYTTTDGGVHWKEVYDFH